MYMLYVLYVAIVLVFISLIVSSYLISEYVRGKTSYIYEFNGKAHKVRLYELTNIVLSFTGCLLGLIVVISIN
jgi:hypothetical protein